MSKPSLEDSVTAWILGVKAGDDQAAQQLWDRYCQALLRLAARHLAGGVLRRADESDVALDAFHSFCRDAADGAYAGLTGRRDFWRLMILYTARKAVDQLRQDRRQCRGGGRVRGESAFLETAAWSDAEAAGIAGVVGNEPSPEFSVMFAETMNHFLGLLPEDHRAIAQLAFQGYTNEETARQIGCSLSTVERRLRTIRAVWTEELQR